MEGIMIIELRKKSQITLPKEIVKELNLLEGDKFEINVINGLITLEPVAIYPKEYLIKLEEEISTLKENSNIKYEAFDNIDDLMKNLKEKGK
jgi:AbrB family looped-hinge helix DNA binding protein